MHIPELERGILHDASRGLLLEYRRPCLDNAILSCTMSVQAEITRSERGLSRLYDRTK
jgi:hypothetical protein